MNSLLLLGLMAFGGVAIALQPSINARLAQKTGIVESSCISFTVGAVALLAVALLAGKGSLRETGAASWWELTGGLLGAFFVTMTIVVVPPPLVPSSSPNSSRGWSWTISASSDSGRSPST